MTALSNDLVGLIEKIVMEHIAAIPKGIEGQIVGYDPKRATVQVLYGHTAATGNFGDLGIGPLSLPWLPLMTPTIGHQAGPNFGDPCVTRVFKGGLGVDLLHTENNSPQVPAGEHHYIHPKPKFGDGSYAGGFYKFTKDGVQSGDNGGGARFFGKSLAVIWGGVKTWLGGVGLDDEMDAVATKRFVMQYITAVFNSHTHPGVQTGSGNTAPPSSPMMFEGSTTTKAAP